MQYSVISRLHRLQFTVAHALGFSDSTSRLLAEAVFSTHADNSLRTGCELSVATNVY
jgi:hypothetical protein